MKLLYVTFSALLAVSSNNTSAFAPTHVSTKPILSTMSSTVRRASSLMSRNMVTESSSPFDFLSGLFPKKENVAEEPKKTKLPDVVIDSDYTLAYIFAAIGVFIILTSPDKTCVPGSSFVCPPSVWGVVQGGLNMLFASFLAIQARRIRFVFDETSFELKNVDFAASNEEVLRASGENFVVGGANRWDYDKFVNYDFFPSVDYPVLVYFKETQTPKEKWNEGPGGLDKVGGGQVHFFPAIANVKQLKEQFEIRGCSKVTNEV